MTNLSGFGHTRLNYFKLQALKQASKQKVHVSKVQDPMALIHEIPIEIPTPSLHLKESGCKKLSLSESV